MDLRTCEKCGETFEPMRNAKGRFCSLACYHAAGRPPRKADVKHRMRRAPDHPLAPAGGVVAISRLTLYDKVGPGEHPCHWCGKALQWIVGGGPGTPGSILADHLDHDATNDDPANLVPSCHVCNVHRTHHGGGRLIRPGEPTVLVNGKPARAIERTCETCDGPFLTVPAQVRAGKGRFCSRSCARRAPRN